MPGYWLNGGALVGTIDGYRQNTIIDEERGTLYQPSLRWDRNRRSEVTTRDQAGHFSGWVWGGGQLLDPDGTIGTDGFFGTHGTETNTDWEPWRLMIKGTTRPYYVAGIVYDATNVPVVGAQVESFVTSTDTKDGVTVSGGDGSYQVPCYNRTATHYVNAYKTGSPDAAGESANTLTPTLTGA